MDKIEQNIFFKRKRIVFLIVIIGFTFLGFVANRWRADLVLEKIKIEGDNLLSAESVLKSSGLQIGTSLYSNDLKEIESKVNKNPYVKNTVVNRNLPSTIDLGITERDPLALIITDKIYYIDNTKHVFPYNFHKEILNLPVISGINFDGKSQIFSDENRIDSVIVLLELLRNKYENIFNLISEINIKNPECIIFYTVNDCIPVVFGTGDFNSKILNFELFWNSSYNNIKKIEFIDLRFKDQVVVKWK